jgi:hypothetical protein
VAKRKEIVKLFRAQRTKAFIQRTAGVSRKHVDRWCKEAAKKRPNYNDKRRSGRKPKLVLEVRRAYRRQAETVGVSAADIASRHNEEPANADNQISSKTVCRVLKSGRKPRAWKKIPSGRRLRSENKAARMEFCKTFKPSPTQPLVFTDGKIVTQTKDKLGLRKHAWVRPDNVPVRTNKRLLAYLHFYGAVAKGFKSSLIFVPPSGSGTNPKSTTNFQAEH